MIFNKTMVFGNVHLLICFLWFPNFCRLSGQTPCDQRADIFALGCIMWECMEHSLCFPNWDRIPEATNTKWSKLPGLETWILFFGVDGC